jgi:thioredoxin reductase (NADPH)
MDASPGPAGVWDVIILGGGPAGLSCAIYCCRGRFSTLILERMMTGGQVVLNDIIENYPGFPEGLPGFELAERMTRHAQRFGAQVQTGEVVGIDVSRRPFRLEIANGEPRFAHALLIGIGSRPRRLDVPGEKEFVTRGVSYCATCDGPLFADRRLAVVGGGDTALEESLFLANIASRVTLIHRRDQLRGQRILQERVLSNPKIDLLWSHRVAEIVGDESVKALRVAAVKTGQEREIPVDGVFIAVGTVPQTSFLPADIRLDEGGFIKTDHDLMTSVRGIFAAGDVRAGAYRQIAFSVGDGALAYRSIFRYLEEQGVRGSLAS